MTIGREPICPRCGLVLSSTAEHHDCCWVNVGDLISAEIALVNDMQREEEIFRYLEADMDKQPKPKAPLLDTPCPSSDPPPPPPKPKPAAELDWAWGMFFLIMLVVQCVWPRRMCKGRI